MSTHELNFSQQCNLIDPNDTRPVTLLGAGSVGSHVASMLVRIGVTNLRVFDDDSIASHNIGPSLYGKDDFGYYKVDALAAIIKRDTGVIIKTEKKKYTDEPLRDTVICCVDSMEARQAIWKRVRKNPFVDMLIDTRVAEEFFQIFSVKPCNERDVAYYEHYLAYSSNEAARQMCGRHSIINVSSMVAAEAVTSLAKFWKFGRTNLHIERMCGSEIFINTGESDE